MRDKSLGCSQRLSLPVCVSVGSYKRAPKHLMDLEHINGVLDGVPFDFPLVAGCVVYGVYNGHLRLRLGRRLTAFASLLAETLLGVGQSLQIKQ